jgi:thiamine-phosphate pyrophosphorylase
MCPPDSFGNNRISGPDFVTVMFLGSFRRRSDSFFSCAKADLSAFIYSNQITAIIIVTVMERAIYRIIDANFNRAREAIRVIEEFCRFNLNSTVLFERTKQLRHELSSAISRLDAQRLIANRDTPGDVGAGKKVDKQLHRENLTDCFTAACKRLTEALRALAEMIQTQNPYVAEKLENLRYTSYTLEKDIVVFSSTFEKFKNVGLYIVITSDMPSDVLSLAHKCLSGGADCIQLRTKAIADDVFYALALEFVSICKSEGVLSIINDRIDIAVAADADGVHLGQNDLPVECVHRLQTKPMIVGKSTHSVEQLRHACDELPTYVGLGPVFATPTKPDAPAVSLDYVKEAKAILSETGIYGVAIGGISTENVEEVLDAGADCVAVCSAVTNSSDPAGECRSLKSKINAFKAGND